MSDSWVIGLDVGGTSTRVLVADLDGTRLGTGRAGGANPTSHPPAVAARELRAALAAALAGLDPARVRAGAIGLAGAGKIAADPTARGAFDEAWRAVGLRCPYRLCGDALVAFASATPAPSGSVLVAGTGAIAAAVRGHALHRVVDGHGWLLGDSGSGFWLGREAARAALAVLDGFTADGSLARSVRSHLLGETREAIEAREAGEAAEAREAGDRARRLASDLVQAVNARPPVTLAELAPLVLAAAPVDPVAARIVDQAADHLVAALAVVHADGLPVVLAGGLLTADTPLEAAVRSRLTARWPVPAPARAGDGAAAAAWLTARELSQVDADRAARLHTALTAPPRAGQW